VQRALTHRSFSADHNERLEFLGDSVLNLSISQWLYEQYPNLPEGELSRMRAMLVKQDTLHQIALHLGLSAKLRLGEGEKNSGGAQRPSILADAVEALIGARYLDQGFEAAKAWVLECYAKLDLQPSALAQAQDAKTRLQEWTQARKWGLPIYTQTASSGAAHKLQFQVECSVPQAQQKTQGRGSSKRAAEQDAAEKMLVLIPPIKP